MRRLGFEFGLIGLWLLGGGLAQADVRTYVRAESGLELQLEHDPDSNYYLQTAQILGDGRVVTLVQPLQLHAQADDVLVGEGLARGKAIQIRVSLAEGDELHWLAPQSLAQSEGGPVAIAGRYVRVDSTKRKHAAQAAFDRSDRNLNQVYGQLRERMDGEDFAELRANQRRWLKFRDWFIADGDDAAINGPGSVNHLRLKTARTLDRVAFLQGLGMPRKQAVLSGRYSDGMDREIRLRAIPTVDRHLFFSLISTAPVLHDPQYQDGPISVSGRASPDTDANAWTVRGDGVSENPLVGADSELLIEPSLDFESVLLSAADESLFTDRLYFVADLQPATEPMRELVLRLPATIFDNTTEGLSERDKTPLLLTGYYEPFRWSESGLDHAEVNYGEGQVDIYRFPEADGGALVAVSTRNVRARSFELWRVDAGGADPTKAPLSQYLPEFESSDFYESATSESAAADGLVGIELRPDSGEIHVRWEVSMDAPEPDFEIDLYWDGHGFGQARYRVGG